MFCALAALLLVAAIGANGSDPSPPRYQFRLGEELVYELAGREDLLEDPETQDRRYETRARWSVYPVRRNDDGSWRLVVRTWVKLLRFDREEGDGESLGAWKDEPFVRLEHEFYSYCDLSPDGAYAENPTLGYSYIFALVPELLFVPLPQARAGEEPLPRTSPSTGNSYALRWGPAAAQRSLTGSLKRPLSDNYESSVHLKIDFDATAGRIVQIVETNESNYQQTPSRTRITYRLAEVIEHTPEWSEKFAQATDDYFAAHNRWAEAIQAATKSRTAAASKRLLDEARSRLVEQRTAIDLEEVGATMDGLIALHDREMKWIVEGAADREALLAQPPVDWTTTNLAGEPRRRTDFSGKVVLLDFWYRGCGHCILALPKVKAIYERYKSEDVVVLGVSNDRDLADARFVMETYAVPYECVRNILPSQADTETPNGDEEGLSGKPANRISSEYKVNGWPTFIVLDQSGRVAEVVSGNADDLVDQLSGVIDGLLDNAGSHEK